MGYNYFESRKQSIERLLSKMISARLLPKSQEKILVITGEDLRHQYFANQVNAHFSLAAILTEAAPYPSPTIASEEEKKAWDWFFTRRAQYESEAFGAVNRLPTLNDPPVIKIPKGQLNSPETVKTINRFHPGFIAVFGTGVLGDKILNLYPGRIFNLHVGLPGFYRGSSCNFWPIYEKQLEKLGAAVHLTTQEIDKGEIAAQTPIDLNCHDNEQTLAGKTLIAGVQLMVSTIKNWRKETLNFSRLTQPGKFFLRKEFTARAVVHVRRMVESGELKHLIKKINERRDQTRDDKN